MAQLNEWPRFRNNDFSTDMFGKAFFCKHLPLVLTIYVVSCNYLQHPGWDPANVGYQLEVHMKNDVCLPVPQLVLILCQLLSVRQLRSAVTAAFAMY